MSKVLNDFFGSYVYAASATIGSSASGTGATGATGAPGSTGPTGPAPSTSQFVDLSSAQTVTNKTLNSCPSITGAQVRVGANGSFFSRLSGGRVISSALNLGQNAGTVIPVPFGIPFTQIPFIVLTLQNVAGGITNGDNLVLSVGSVTLNGFDLWCKNPFSSTVTGEAQIAWFAFVPL